MMRNISRQALRGFALLGGALLLAGAPAASAPAIAQTTGVPSSGIVCTKDEAHGTNPTFTLTTQDGYIGLPDGNLIYMWGYSSGNDPFQYPGPVLCVNQGDTVTVVLNNTLSDDASVIFPGQENVLANGAAAQPQFDGTGALTSLTNVAHKSGGSVTYSFVAGKPGTYLYESGTDSGKQVLMGLAGALVVRPTGVTPPAGAACAYDCSAQSLYDPDTEYVLLLSEIDPAMHASVERGISFDMADYKPRYWLMNGRGFPDTIAPNNASWLPGQPYSSLSHIHPYDSTNNPYPSLMRYLSVGTVDYPFHPHGNSARVIARDGTLLATNGANRSYEKFSFPVGPGQTWDSTFVWEDLEHWSPGRPVPVDIPRDQNLTYGLYYGGTPYLGTQGALPPGTQDLNECGEYYHVAHSHALSQLTAWGVTMSGMLTYTRIDPPLPNNCPVQ